MVWWKADWLCPTHRHSLISRRCCFSIHCVAGLGVEESRLMLKWCIVFGEADQKNANVKLRWIWSWAGGGLEEANSGRLGGELSKSVSVSLHLLNLIPPLNFSTLWVNNSVENNFWRRIGLGAQGLLNAFLLIYWGRVVVGAWGTFPALPNHLGPLCLTSANELSNPGVYCGPALYTVGTQNIWFGYEKQLQDWRAHLWQGRLLGHLVLWGLGEAVCIHVLSFCLLSV